MIFQGTLLLDRAPHEIPRGFHALQLRCSQDHDTQNCIHTDMTSLLFCSVNLRDVYTLSSCALSPFVKAFTSSSASRHSVPSYHPYNSLLSSFFASLPPKPSPPSVSLGPPANIRGRGAIKKRIIKRSSEFRRNNYVCLTQERGFTRVDSRRLVCFRTFGLVRHFLG